jgi:hypothetical protein
MSKVDDKAVILSLICRAAACVLAAHVAHAMQGWAS